MRDPELMNGLQDADFEMREIQAAASLSSAVRRSGNCDHGWSRKGIGQTRICNHCEKEFADDRALETDRRRALHHAQFCDDQYCECE